MGVLTSTVSRQAELEEFRRALRSEATAAAAWQHGSGGVRKDRHGEPPVGDARFVCVTSGVSFLGFAVAHCLRSRGYSVRLALDSQEDLDKLREMEIYGDAGMDGVCAVVADVMDLDSLCRAFDGCSGVFHSSAFADPSGISGYSKQMAEMEAKVAEKVVEACVRTESVRKCVFTSSLLACVWRRSSPLNQRLPAIVDENCWTDETLCRDRKLWFASGKTMAEKAAWRVARGRNLKLVSICPGLITGPGFCRRNSTASIAYLKGSQELFAEGLLATVDVRKVADAHVRVYEAMGSTACGRYICYDHVVKRDDEATELERQLGMPNRISTRAVSSSAADHPVWFELSNKKLSRLISASRRCCYDSYSMLD